MFGFLLGSLCAKLYVDVGFVNEGKIFSAVALQSVFCLSIQNKYLENVVPFILKPCVKESCVMVLGFSLGGINIYLIINKHDWCVCTIPV